MLVHHSSRTHSTVHSEDCCCFLCCHSPQLHCDSNAAAALHRSLAHAWPIYAQNDIADILSCTQGCCAGMSTPVARRTRSHLRERCSDDGKSAQPSEAPDAAAGPETPDNPEPLIGHTSEAVLAVRPLWRMVATLRLNNFCSQYQRKNGTNVLHTVILLA